MKSAGVSLAAIAFATAVACGGVTERGDGGAQGGVGGTIISGGSGGTLASGGSGAGGSGGTLASGGSGASGGSPSCNGYADCCFQACQLAYGMCAGDVQECQGCFDTPSGVPDQCLTALVAVYTCVLKGRVACDAATGEPLVGCACLPELTTAGQQCGSSIECG